MANCSPMEYKILSLDFEKKLLLFQLEQERAKSVHLVDAAHSELKQNIENLTLKLKEKDETIVHLLSSQQQPLNNNPNTTNDTATEASSMCDENNSNMQGKIEDLEKELALCIKDKEKFAYKLQMNVSEKHTLLGQIFQMTMEKQSMVVEKEKFLQNFKELKSQLKIQNEEKENLSKKAMENEKQHLNKIQHLQQQLELSTIEKGRCNNEIAEKKKMITEMNIKLKTAKDKSVTDELEFKVKLDNLNVNLNTKSNQLKEQEQIVSDLRKELHNIRQGGKFRNVCSDIQELGKNMELLLDQQLKANEKLISDLQRQVKEFKLCSICYDEMESNGEHRAVSLPCGHIFGDKCLRLSLQTTRNCPKCRVAANPQGLRFVYLD